jgi:hypothetical protein
MRCRIGVCSWVAYFKVIMGWGAIWGLIFLMSLTIAKPAAHAQVISDTTIYKVDRGDWLSKIALKYGQMESWRRIYVANQDRIQDPDLIYPGQRFLIPHDIITRPDSTAPSHIEAVGASEITALVNKVLARRWKSYPKKQPIRPRFTNYNGLEIGGLVINETRSKIGNDFFRAFYKSWENPEEAPNFIVQIREMPMPSLGTVILVHLDNQPIFKTRLQPKREMIERYAEWARRICYRKINQKFNSLNKVAIY